MDPRVEPCSDFHRHVCNKWMLDYNTDIVNTAHTDAIKVATDTLLSTGGPSTVTIPEAFRQFYTACYSFLATTSPPSPFAIFEPLRLHVDILYTDNFSMLIERAILLSLDQGIHVAFKLSLVNDTGRASLHLSMAKTLTENLDSEATEIDEGYMLRSLLDYALAGTSMRTSATAILKLDQTLSFRGGSEPTLRLPIATLGVIFSKLVKRASEGGALAWMDRTSRSSHLSVLRSVRLKLFDDNSDDGSRNIVPSWDESTEGFPSDFLRAKRKTQRRSFREPNSLYADLQDVLLYKGKVVYARPLGAVVVPATVANWPLCYNSEEVPPEFNLGTVGYLMATEMARAPFVHFPNGTRGLGKLTEIRRFANCIRPVADAVMETPLSNVSQDVAIEMFVRARAARLAFDVLKEIGGVDAEAGRVAQMTFFRRFCLLACNSGDSA
ncbi:hypothetical protein MTO96_005569 [Rhipicephalus appendiculatus]